MTATGHGSRHTLQMPTGMHSPSQYPPPGKTWPGLYEVKPQVKRMTSVNTQSSLFTSLFSYCRDVRAAAEVLTAAAARARAARDYEKLGLLSEGLLSLELSPARASIARYYQALAELKGGTGDSDAAEVLLDLARPAAPTPLLERISLTQSFIAYYKGDTAAHLEICELLMRSDDVMVAVEAGQAIAVVIGLEGRHEKSLNLLEALYPIVRRLPRCPLYFNFHNSYAEESKQAGRLDQAAHLSAVALASPHAHAFPEYKDTARDVAAMRRQTNVAYLCDANEKRRKAEAREELSAMLWPDPDTLRAWQVEKCKRAVRQILSN
jgi:hypothetical protein